MAKTWTTKASWSSSDPFGPTQIDGIADDDRNWGGPVNANGYALTAIGNLAFVNAALPASPAESMQGYDWEKHSAVFRDATGWRYPVAMNASGWVNKPSGAADALILGNLPYAGGSEGDAIRWQANGGVLIYRTLVRINASGLGRWCLDGYSGVGTYAERLCVNDEGRVGIGTVSPQYQLHLSTDSAAKPTTNTWTTASDERVKTDIQPFTDGLEKILALAPVSYKLNGMGGMPEGAPGISVLAQATQPILPYCVGSYRGKLHPEDEGETDILTLNTSALTWVFVNALKEIDARLKALEAA